MDNFASILAGGGVSGVIIAISILLFRYLDKHKIKCISGCCRLAMEQDRSPKLENKSDTIEEIKV
jgi:hypothetical protein